MGAAYGYGYGAGRRQPATPSKGALPALPPGFAFVVDEQGRYYVNESGDYYIMEVA